MDDLKDLADYAWWGAIPVSAFAVLLVRRIFDTYTKQDIRVMFSDNIKPLMKLVEDNQETLRNLDTTLTDFRLAVGRRRSTDD